MYCRNINDGIMSYQGRRAENLWYEDMWIPGNEYNEKSGEEDEEQDTSHSTVSETDFIDVKNIISEDSFELV